MSHILDEELYQALMAIAACPTAPCHEVHVRARLLERLKDLPHVTTRLDEFGNLHASYEHRVERESFRVVAHMDHPGFVVHRKKGSEELHFAGGVEEKYFAGKGIVFHHDETTEPLGRAVIEGTSFSDDVKRVVIDRAIPADATFAVWDLPRARCTKRLFLSPACDDLAQVSTAAGPAATAGAGRGQGRRPCYFHPGRGDRLCRGAGRVEVENAARAHADAFA